MIREAKDYDKESPFRRRSRCWNLWCVSGSGERLRINRREVFWISRLDDLVSILKYGLYCANWKCELNINTHVVNKIRFLASMYLFFTTVMWEKGKHDVPLTTQNKLQFYQKRNITLVMDLIRSSFLCIPPKYQCY